MEGREPQESDIAPLARVVEHVADDLEALRERVDGIDPAAYDPMTRHELAALGKRLGMVMDSLVQLAHTPSPPKEIPKIPKDAELYKYLLGPDFWQKSRLTDYTMPPLIITIVDDTGVMLDGRRVGLSREEVYVFNRLVVTPGFSTYSFVERFLRDGEPMPRAHKRVLGIYRKFRLWFGDTVLVQDTGITRGYRFSSNIMLIDRRLEKEMAWGTVEDIAAMARVDPAAAHAFVEQNRAQIGNYFARSQRLHRPTPDGRGYRESEYFSPWFVRWAVTKLKEQA